MNQFDKTARLYTVPTRSASSIPNYQKHMDEIFNGMIGEAAKVGLWNPYCDNMNVADLDAENYSDPDRLAFNFDITEGNFVLVGLERSIFEFAKLIFFRAIKYGKSTNQLSHFVYQMSKFSLLASVRFNLPKEQLHTALMQALSYKAGNRGNHPKGDVPMRESLGIFAGQYLSDVIDQGYKLPIDHVEWIHPIVDSTYELRGGVEQPVQFTPENSQDTSIDGSFNSDTPEKDSKVIEKINNLLRGFNIKRFATATPEQLPTLLEEFADQLPAEVKECQVIIGENSPLVVRRNKETVAEDVDYAEQRSNYINADVDRTLAELSAKSPEELTLTEFSDAVVGLHETTPDFEVIDTVKYESQMSHALLSLSAEVGEFQGFMRDNMFAKEATSELFDTYNQHLGNILSVLARLADLSGDNLGDIGHKFISNVTISRGVKVNGEAETPDVELEDKSTDLNGNSVFGGLIYEDAMEREMKARQDDKDLDEIEHDYYIRRYKG